MKTEYPSLVIDLKKIRHNAQTLLGKANQNSVNITGVVKGVNALPKIVEAFVEAQVKSIGSSRMEQLKYVKSTYPDIETMMLRIPMLSELEFLVEYGDISLNSEMRTLMKLNEICMMNNVTHGVILMVDMGDLREGFFEKKDLYEAAEIVENQLEYLNLKGIGTNLGCYGSIEPDVNNLGELVRIARIIEHSIGRKLEIISGGATTTFPMILNNTLPEGINHLRIGDGIFLRDMEAYFDYTFDEMFGDAFTIEAEIIEVKNKASYPIGTISVDAFGNKPQYIDIGNRIRALLAIGRQDLGDVMKLIPYDTKIKIIGGSSDHTIIDITDCDIKYKVGDVLRFNIEYELLLYSTSSLYVHKRYIN